MKVIDIPDREDSVANKCRAAMRLAIDNEGKAIDTELPPTASIRAKMYYLLHEFGLLPEKTIRVRKSKTTGTCVLWVCDNPKYKGE